MEKVTNSLNISVPQGSFVDEGEGVVTFPNGLTITDTTVQRNGTRYDIDSLDTSRYGNQLTGDHEDRLSSLIGEVQGTSKLNGRVVVNKIRYAIKENPYARLAYDLLVGGFSKNFSTETIGPAPDIDGVYKNAELVGLSQVVTQNNYNAHVNKFVHNSLERAKQDGLDVTGIEDKLMTHNSLGEPEKEKMDEKETKETETKISETETKVVPDQKVVIPVTPEQSTKVEAPQVVDAPTETQKTETETTEKVTETKNEADKAQAVEEADGGKKIVETPHDPAQPIGSVQTDEANKAAQIETKTEEVSTSTEQKETNNKEDKMEEKTSNSLTAEQVAEIVTNAMKPLSDKVSSLETEAKNAFDASAKEPEFKKDENKVEEKVTNAYAAMPFEERYQAQVDAAWNAVKMGNVEAWQKLRDINSVNLDKLKEAGIAKNAMTLDDLGNFVIAPEMYNAIAGTRTDYTPILDNTEWRETLSLEFAWLQRTGDIDMRSVALNATATSGAGADANLKPMSEYTATPKTSALEELAAVTVVATSATRFAAVDLLADAAAGYRNDYDRKRAQLVIARLQEAVNENGFVTGYDPVDDANALTAWIDAVTQISDTTLNGTLIFNARTFAELKSRALRAGANGPLSEILTTGNLPTVFGYRFVIVPNDLMPSLGGSETIAHEVEGVDVPITCAVFFADLGTFTGRTSGGLQYDVSNSASYESGGVVKSAYQRNELVLRGSFFRGGAVRDVRVVSGVVTGAVS